MNYAQLINAVQTALSPLVVEAGGRVRVAESLDEARNMLASSPTNWRVILHWEGFGEHPSNREGMTTHNVATVIQARRGLVHEPDPTKTKPSGAPGFHSYITALIGWMGAMRFPNGTGADVAGFKLASSQWLETQAGFSAHSLSWQLDAAIPPHALNIPLSFPDL